MKKNKQTTIYLIITGGLGNQLFEYAFARNLNLSIPNSKLIIDSSSYKKYKIRNFELNNFNIPKDVEIKPGVIKGFKKLYFLFFKSLHRLEFKLFTKKRNGSKYFSDRLFRRNESFGVLTCFDVFHHKINISKLKNKKNIYVFGYYQSPLYFKEYENEILSELTPVVNSEKVDCFCDNLSNDSVCYSFRCSELKKMGLFLEDFNDHFFDKVTEVVRGLKTTNVVLFTEDSKNAKEYLRDFNKYLPGYTFSPAEQLYIMSKCKYFVVSNSSFSWWGSYLSRDNNKVIYAPKHWYKNCKTKDIGLYYDKIKIIE